MCVKFCTYQPSCISACMVLLGGVVGGGPPGFVHSCRVNPEIKYARRFKALKIPDIVHTKVTEKLFWADAVS